MSTRTDIRPYDFAELEGEVVLKFKQAPSNHLQDKDGALDRVFKQQRNLEQHQHLTSEIDQFLGKVANDPQQDNAKLTPPSPAEKAAADPLYNEKLIMTETEFNQRLDSIKADGYKEGYDKRSEEVKVELEAMKSDYTQKLQAKEQENSQLLSQSLDKLSDSMAACADKTAVEQTAIDTAIQFSHSLVKKVTKAEPDKTLTNIVKDAVNQVMPNIISYPQIRISAPGPICRQLKDYIHQVKKQYNYNGEFIIDETGEDMDQVCNVSWRDGFATIDSDHIWQQVDDIISKSVGNSNIISSKDGAGDADNKIATEPQEADYQEVDADTNTNNKEHLSDDNISTSEAGVGASDQSKPEGLMPAEKPKPQSSPSAKAATESTSSDSNMLQMPDIDMD